MHTTTPHTSGTRRLQLAAVGAMAALTLAACADSDDNDPLAPAGSDGIATGDPGTGGDDPAAGVSDAGWAVFTLGDEQFRAEIDCYALSDGFYVSQPEDLEVIAPEGVDPDTVSFVAEIFGDDTRATVSHGDASDGGDGAFIWGIGPWSTDRGSVTSLEANLESQVATLQGQWEQSSPNSVLDEGELRDGTFTVTCP